MKTLVINTGSSSIKYQLFDMPDPVPLCSGLIEKIGEAKAHITHSRHIPNQHDQTFEKSDIINDHQDGMKWVARLLTHHEHGVVPHTDEIGLVGHRVVHGGEHFSRTTIITKEVKETIEKLSGLAPLHNPPNLTGIKVAEQVFNKARQVAVFDTAFHQTLPEHAFRYAIPNSYYREHGIRVYGFHGTSHRYVTKEAARYLDLPMDKINIITIHLGNGASMAAVREGKSIDTTLGLTPLPGLVMGTRCGDIDPGVLFYLHDSMGMSIKEINNMLNKESGMKGLAGANDLRTVLSKAQQGNSDARVALEIYSYRIKKYIGAYMAAIGPLHAIVFTAGVGENSPMVRKMATHGLSHLGISIDEDKNSTPHTIDISSESSAIRILVIPTNEELEIARQAFDLDKTRI